LKKESIITIGSKGSQQTAQTRYQHVPPPKEGYKGLGNAMKVKLSRKHVLTVCLVLAVFTAGRCHASTRILFIGNSYTYVNDLDKQLEGLAPSTETARIVAGGYTLEKHWTDGKALQKIREGRWDYVILQEQSQTPISGQQKFYDFARKFDKEIRLSGAKTILLMTWGRPDSSNYGVTTANLAAAFTALGTELGAKVVPAGLAFARSLHEKPELALYSRDGHPTVEGTYLAACVLYGTIFEQSPVGNPYSERSISAETRAYLQRIAAEAWVLSEI
jgi:hypothetical protein